MPLVHNPFATRSIRPGAIPYWFEGPGVSMALLVDQLARSGRGQIIGPHGSGKSTLIASLAPALEAAGRPTRLITFHAGDRGKLWRAWRAFDLPAPLGRKDVLLIDGYEQLGGLARALVQLRCRRSGCGLVATAHADLGFTTLHRTDVTPAVAEHVIAHLAREAPQMMLSGQAAMDRVNARQGSLREVLFDLYDEYERQRPA